MTTTVDITGGDSFSSCSLVYSQSV